MISPWYTLWTQQPFLSFLSSRRFFIYSFWLLLQVSFSDFLSFFFFPCFVRSSSSKTKRRRKKLYRPTVHLLPGFSCFFFVVVVVSANPWQRMKRKTEKDRERRRRRRRGREKGGGVQRTWVTGRAPANAVATRGKDEWRRRKARAPRRTASPALERGCPCHAMA